MKDKEHILDIIRSDIDAFKGDVEFQEVGRVSEVADGVARVLGLHKVKMTEMVRFLNTEGSECGVGVVFNLEEYSVGVVVLTDFTHIKEGFIAERTNKILSIPVSASMIGRVVTPLGDPIDGKGAITNTKDYPMERIAPGIIFRQPVDTPLSTGVKAVDSMIPIGRGQRQLIIGDRQTGKTALAIDAIINQKDQDVICVYVAIGQKESKIAKIVDRLEKEGAMKHTIIVVASAAHPAALLYLAPYAGTAIGEYFMDQGKDALVVFDDLSKHAWAYRQISLLLRRPPGREAYPGDVFYLHSRLLERSARMAKEHGGGSLTALPIIETQSGDVSAYIPTNVISITDGQIYLESDLFYRGVRPAINVGLSVSRVGGAAQIKAIKKVASRLRLELAQFRELEAFAQFSSDLDPATKAQIERGRRLTELLKQLQYEPMPVVNQVVSLYAGVNGYLDDVEVTEVRVFEQKLQVYIKTSHKDILESIREKKDILPEVEAKLKKAIESFKKSRT